MASHSRFLVSAVLSVGALFGQSSIQTLAGGGPNGIPATSASLNTPVAVASDARGNIYVALRLAHRVMKIDPSGILTVFAGGGSAGYNGDSIPATSATLYEPLGLAVDQGGNVYIADSKNYRIRRVDTNGTITTAAGTGVLGNTGNGGPAVNARINIPSAMTFDAYGNLYFCDRGNHQLRRITPDGAISTIAGYGTVSARGDGGPAAASGLNAPNGVAIDQTGQIFIADTGNHQIRVIGTDGNINLYGGNGSANFYGDGGDIGAAYFNSPGSLVFDKAGYLYIADVGNDRVRRVDLNGVVNTYAGTGTRGAGGDKGPAKYANINLQGLGQDGHNNLLIADGDNARVRIVNSASGLIDTIGGDGLTNYGGDGGPGTGAVLGTVRGIVVKGDTVYFSDTDNNRIRKLSLSTGVIDLVCGDGQLRYYGDGGLANVASLNNPRGLALDSAGNLYIADSGNSRIRRITSDGKINSIAGNGTATYAGDGGAATSASLLDPTDVAVDSSGNVYVAERSGHRIRKFTVGGSINTVAGNGTAGAPAGDGGNGTDQMLNFPAGLALGPQGDLFIADGSNNRIRRLATDGTIYTYAGTGRTSYGGDGGKATSAFIRNPTGISLDSSGNLYIGDTDNHVVRRVDTNGNIETVAGISANPAVVTRSGGFNGDGSPATAVNLNRPQGLAVVDSCSVLIDDSVNQRVRLLRTGGDFLVDTQPPGLQVSVDGKLSGSGPVTVSVTPGSAHHIDGPSPQYGAAGIRYVTQGGQDVTPSCGDPLGFLSLNFGTEFLLTVTNDPTGTVSAADQWQSSGASVTLTATPGDGFVFAGWTGDCTGTDVCQLTMDGPKTVNASFAPAGQ